MLIKNCKIKWTSFIRTVFYFKLVFVYRLSKGSQWLSKEDIENLTVEKLSDHEVYLKIHTYIYLVNEFKISSHI